MSTLARRTDATRPRSTSSDRPEWQRALADAVTDPAELCRLVGLGPQVADAARRSEGNLPLLVPRAYLARIRPGDLQDPLLAQVLPSEEELEETVGFTTDPVREADHARTYGLLRKYRGRALILATEALSLIHI